jgi:small-conductance mechanosensitive channel
MSEPLTNPPVVHNLIDALLTDLSDTYLLLQASLILLALGLGWLANRQIEKRMPEETAQAWLGHDWKRFLIPLFALLFILVVRPILAKWHSVHLLNLAVPLLTSMFTIQFSFFFLRSLFRPGPGLHTIERSVSWLIWGAVALHITGHLHSVIGALDGIGFDIGKQHISLYTALLGLISIAATLIAALSIGRLIENRLIAGSNLNANLKVALGKIVRSALLFLAVLVALPLVGIDITVLSVFGGALGVGLGLGLQKIASNYVSGFTLLLDNSIRIGDMVTVGDRFGEVTQIATRYTVIRSLDGSEAIIPNESLITSTVVNHSLSNPDNLVSIPVQVAYETDLKQAEAIMIEAATRHPRVLSSRPPAVRLVGFGESGIDLKLIVWIDDPEDGQLPLVSDINWAIWEGFQREGIQIPYPQRVVHLSRDAVEPSAAKPA